MNIVIIIVIEYWHVREYVWNKWNDTTLADSTLVLLWIWCYIWSIEGVCWVSNSLHGEWMSPRLCFSHHYTVSVGTLLEKPCWRWSWQGWRRLLYVAHFQKTQYSTFLGLCKALRHLGWDLNCFMWLLKMSISWGFCWLHLIELSGHPNYTSRQGQSQFEPNQ